MAPEVLNKQNWEYTVDFYALGVILYEIIMNKKPYKGKTRNILRDQVNNSSAKIEPKELPKDWSESARDLTNKLLIRDPQGMSSHNQFLERIGYEGIEEIFTHPWLDDIDWDKLQEKKLSKLLYYDQP